MVQWGANPVDKNAYSQQAILEIVIYHEQRNLYLATNGVLIFSIKEPMKTRYTCTDVIWLFSSAESIFQNFALVFEFLLYFICFYYLLYLFYSHRSILKM